MGLKSLRNGLEAVRVSKMSTRLTVMFVAAFVVPWFVYAWAMTTGRTAEVERVERNLAALAAAYGEHATTLMRFGIPVPADGNAAPSDPAAMRRGAEEVAAFHSALNVPGVRFGLRKITQPGNALPRLSIADAAPDLSPLFRRENGVLFAEVDRPLAGIAASASIDESVALKDWRERAETELIALVLRSLFVAGIGIFLVQQLRHREAADAALVKAKEAAEQASRAKSAFLANMSHELRTPLNAIIGFSEIIKNRQFGVASERYPEYAGHVFDSGTHLLSLINDILNLSKLEAGRLNLEEDDFDLKSTFEASLKFVEMQARLAQVNLSMRLDHPDLWVRADERRLRQVLINLLSNAVKFTPEGGHVVLSSALVKEGLAISVRDTGIGMAAEDIPNAMAPFGQVESVLRRKREGTGLGLPLAKQLIELHGGTFTIESRLNEGTTVRFVLTRERILEAPRWAETASSAA